ncbi:MAG: class D beta-lactamase [Candidatus Puniceispirillum sp.]|nr:class D beta-lactamase [Candidatus Pelagibacter sp.]MBA4283560.1 class D beta-lactamase [Candidatus Puniceispirillum sp.]
MKICNMKKFILSFCAAIKCLASTEGVDALDVNPLSVSMLVCNKEMQVEYIEGDCYKRYSPCSTFKFPLAIMGFNSGILQTEEEPAWVSSPDHEIFLESWRCLQTPHSWIQNSVVWYSQELTQMLGFEKINEYIHQWNYGNKDVSGTPGMNDGLTHSWLNSSLQISTKEQILFIHKFINSELLISSETWQKIENIMYVGDVEDWEIFGKTGGSGKYEDEKYPDILLQHGWFIGWCTKEMGGSLMFRSFAIHIIEQYNEDKKPGIHAKEIMMKKIHELVYVNRMRSKD